MTVSDLNNLAPSVIKLFNQQIQKINNYEFQIPWVEFLSGMFGREITDDQPLLVKNVGNFITRLESLIDKTEER